MASANTVTLIITAKDEASSQLGKMSDDFSKSLKTASVAVGAVGVALTAYAKDATSFTTDLVGQSKAVSRQTGETVEDSSKLLYVFKQVGLSADTASSQFNIFSKQIQANNEKSAESAQTQAELKNKIDAANISIAKYRQEIKDSGDTSGDLKNKIQGLTISIQGYQTQLSAAATPLEQINVATKNADGSARSFNDILLDVSDRFQAMPAGAEKTSLALQLFGRSGDDMIKILDKGRTGIVELQQQADALGLTLTKDTIGSIDAYIASSKRLKDSTDSMKLAVGSLTAPVLTKFNLRLNETLQKVIGVNSPFRSATASVLAFGGPIAGATSAVTALAANLVTAGPLVARLGLLFTPMGLAATAATVGVGLLATQLFKHATYSYDAAAGTEKMTGANARYGSSVDLLTLATDRRNDATKALDDSIAKAAATTELYVASQNAEQQNNLAVANAQQAVNDALSTYGANSPQYAAATESLKSVQDRLNDALFTELGNNLQVVNSEQAVKDKRNELASATADLNGLQDYLNKGIENGRQIIANFGPTALGQVAGVKVLDDSIASVVKNFANMTTEVQSQSVEINNRLQGVNSTLQAVQGQSKLLSASLQNAGGATLQNAGASLQGTPKHALGTSFAAGGAAIINESGPELVDLPRGARVHSADESQALARGGLLGSGVNIENLNVNNSVDVGLVARAIGFALAIR